MVRLPSHTEHACVVVMRLCFLVPSVLTLLCGLAGVCHAAGAVSGRTAPLESAAHPLPSCPPPFPTPSHTAPMPPARAVCWLLVCRALNRQSFQVVNAIRSNFDGHRRSHAPPASTTSLSTRVTHSCSHDALDTVTRRGTLSTTASTVTSNGDTRKPTALNATAPPSLAVTVPDTARRCVC